MYWDLLNYKTEKRVNGENSRQIYWQLKAVNLIVLTAFVLEIFQKRKMLQFLLIAKAFLFFKMFQICKNIFMEIKTTGSDFDFNISVAFNHFQFYFFSWMAFYVS